MILLNETAEAQSKVVPSSILDMEFSLKFVEYNAGFFMQNINQT
jgi:hypothetical protein